ncbi:MAG: hypothetical protein ACLGIF_02900, partial [Actinomycetes bacterium]
MLGFLPRLPTRPPAHEVTPADREAPASDLPLALDLVASGEEFDAISVPAGDLVANGRIAKFLIDRRDPAAARVKFVNGNFTLGGQVPDSARFHYFFAQAAFGIPESLAEFNAATYFTHDKRYVAGTVHTYLLDSATRPVYGIQFYPQ